MNIQCIPTPALYLKRRAVEVGLHLLDEDGFSILDEAGRKIAPEQEPPPEEPPPEEFAMELTMSEGAFHVFGPLNPPAGATAFILQYLEPDFEGSPAWIDFDTEAPYDNNNQTGEFRLLAYTDETFTELLGISANTITASLPFTISIESYVDPVWTLTAENIPEGYTALMLEAKSGEAWFDYDGFEPFNSWDPGLFRLRATLADASFAYSNELLLEVP